MSSRTEARREILQEAHEGHEEPHPKIRTKRVGPRKWMSGEFGYDYLESILNWEVSRRQLAGILVMLVGMICLLLLLFMFGPHFPS